MRAYHIIEETPTTLLATNYAGERISLHILDTPKLNIDMIKQFYACLIEQSIPHGIMVYRTEMTSSVKRVLQDIQQEFILELFSWKQLQFNLLRHTLVPFHQAIPRDPCKDYSKYPILKKHDPVARFLGFKPGQLIKIIRHDGTIYFRIVK